MKKLILILCLCLLSLSLASETQRRFRVFVMVFEGDHGDPLITKELETLIKKDLLALGDVDIVDFTEQWHFILEVAYIQHRTVTGDTTGWLSLVDGFYERVPPFYFKDGHYPRFRVPPVYIEGLGVANYKENRLQEYSQWLVGECNRKHLVRIRELLNE